MKVGFSEKIKMYINAIENEKVFDELSYETLGLKAKDFFYIPRPSKWYSRLPFKIKSNKFLCRFLFLFLYLFGVLFGWVFIFIIFLRYLFLKSKSLALSEKITFVNGDRSYKCISSAVNDFSEYSIVCLRPGASYSDDVHSVAECLNVKSKFKVLFLSLATYFKLVFSANFSLVFQLYTSIQCFSVIEMIVMSKPRVIVISQHFDRWAVLIDSLSGFLRKDNEEYKFVIVQHGIERRDIFQSMQEANIDFNKLNFVNFLFSYSESQSQIFSQYIFSLSSCAEVLLYNTEKIKLTKIYSHENKYKFLFIGHPVYEKVQIALYRKLVEVFEVKCFYKPHPTAGMSDFCGDIGWEVLDDMIFPEVDYLISYESTLALEYQALGVIGFIHGEAGDNNVIAKEVDAMLAFFSDKLKCYN